LIDGLGQIPVILTIAGTDNPSEVIVLGGASSYTLKVTYRAHYAIAVPFARLSDIIRASPLCIRV
jgi:hypothetical protein